MIGVTSSRNSCVYRAKAAPTRVPTTPRAPVNMPIPRVTLLAALGASLAEAELPEADELMLPLMLPVALVWPEVMVLGAEVSAAETVAGSTELVAGTYIVRQVPVHA